MPGQKIKILHLIKSLGRGGAETLLVETAKFHDLTKLEIHVIYFLPWKNQLVAALHDLGVKVTNIPASNNLQLIRSCQAVENYIHTHSIDLIHCHLPWAGFLGRRIFKRSGLPVIYTEHNKQERYHIFTRLINRFTFNNQSQVIAVSNDVRHSILKSIPVEIPVTTVSNGVDTELYKKDDSINVQKRASLGIASDEVVIGTLAVFRKQKCLHHWLDVFAELYARNNKIRGVIVGDGPLRHELEFQIKNLGLTNIVITPGMQTNASDWYNVMDIFMITSEFEGLPLALLEAMASEKPIVSTNAGGIKEAVVQSETGFLFNFGEWNGMADSVDRLINNPGLRSKMGQAGRQRVINNYSLLNMVNSLENIYQQHVH